MLHRLTVLVALALASPALAASTLVVQVPDGVKVQAATATAAKLKLDVKGTITGNAITFASLLPDTAYDVKLTLADGAVYQGADMGWYMPEPKTESQPLDDDDRRQIKEIFDGVKAFENRRNMLAISGNHDRVTILTELIRDEAFHSSKGDEVIWRVELWYFKNQHGGWEKVGQQNKVLRRERFATRQEYLAATSKLKWVPELGGLKVGKDQTKTIEFAPSAAKSEK